MVTNEQDKSQNQTLVEQAYQQGMADAAAFYDQVVYDPMTETYYTGMAGYEGSMAKEAASLPRPLALIRPTIWSLRSITAVGEVYCFNKPMEAVKVNLIFARQSIVGPHLPPGGIFAGSATTSKYGKFSITVPPVFLRMRLHVFIYITYPYIVGGRLSRHIAKVHFFRKFGGKLLLIFGMTGNRIVLKSNQCRNYVFNLDRQRGDCINHENYPLNFSFVIEGKLAGSAHPQRHSQLRSLFNDCGIRAILTLTEGDLSSHLRDRSDYILEQLELFHIPIQDFTAPTMADLKRAVRWIYRMKREDKPVLVHCGAGRGRTGTILTAFFMSNYNLTADDALTRIRELRPGSVETSEQEDRLREFEGELQLPGLP